MTTLPHRGHVPVLVIGTGIAGLTAAFTLASAGIKVLLVTKAADPADCNTAWAQGGIIYQGENDSAEKLVSDVIRAGAGISNLEAVHFLAEEGPRVVEKVLLNEMHVPFSTTHEGELDLTQEGAHSVSRIIHAGDATGRAIETSLLNRVKGEPNITLATEVTAIDLLTTQHHPQDIQVRYRLTNECVGAYLLDNRTNDVYTVFADYTILATGGVGQIYLHTTNTRSSLGDGVVMASRAGAKIFNAEYVQFHPTALADKKANHFLISEALRGEGARLRNQRGEYFMERYAPELKDLAPRDVVARAIVEEMTHNKEEFVWLDLANFYNGREPIAERFPNIRAACAEMGVDIERDPIPVVPAAHYFCGGVLVNTRGETTLSRLYAIGETSCSGLHGANRLASTSLLEGVTWGYFAAESIREKLTSPAATASPAVRRAFSSLPPGTGSVHDSIFASIPDWLPPGKENLEDPALILQDWTTIQHTMWNYVGIVRTYERLKRAVADMRQLGNRLTKYYHESTISKSIVELFHGQQMAAIVASAAIRNPRSIGAHFRAD
ncbi:MAG: FAD-dependent oxidoreductase [Acidobacteria bacterium]|nr:FAD-dependent oxidoreductase [Acidobacteriota bacterium]MBV9475284.1 FAD-dependent oxidoreductase [Acidobacteriota bacterium]